MNDNQEFEGSEQNLKYTSLRETIFSRDQLIKVKVKSSNKEIVDGDIAYTRMPDLIDGKPGHRIDVTLTDEGKNQLIDRLKNLTMSYGSWKKNYDAINNYVDSGESGVLRLNFDYEGKWNLSVDHNRISWQHPASTVDELIGQTEWPYLPPGIDILDADDMKIGDKDWIERQIQNGEFKVNDERQVPVRKITREALKMYVKEHPPQEGNIVLFHGTALNNIPGILRYGSFGRGPDRGGDYKPQDPTYSTNPLGIPIQFADYSGNEGCLIVIECPQNEFENQGGHGETVGIPAKKYGGNVERLRSAVPDSVLNQDPRVIESNRIREIIIPQG